jgi:hypothetical protein
VGQHRTLLRRQCDRNAAWSKIWTSFVADKESDVACMLLLARVGFRAVEELLAAVVCFIVVHKSRLIHLRLPASGAVEHILEGVPARVRHGLDEWDVVCCCFCCYQS